MKDSPFDCYKPEYRIQYVSSLVIFGAEHFKEAYIVQNLEKLNKIVQTGSQQVNELFPYMKNSLMDSIRITIFFENFLKSVLIDNKFLVHKISDKPKYKDLKKNNLKDQ